MSGLEGLDRPGAPAGEWVPPEWITRPGTAAAEHTDGTEHADGTDRAARTERAESQDAVTGPRRGGVDPVKALMHRHRELCERAVDPLEIAAGLEAHGLTDRAAAQYRHRDVFSLAEEMYARVPRQEATPGQAPAERPASSVRPAWVLLSLLPGALCAATVAGLRLTHGTGRQAVLGAGVLAVAVAVRAVLRHGPLSPLRRPRPVPHRAVSATCWLLLYAAVGDGLLAGAVAGGPDRPPGLTPDAPWPLTAAPLLTLALACAPAAVCAHLLAVHAGRRLHVSRGLAEFARAVRPLLLGTVALFTAALAGLTALCGVVLGEPAAYARVLPLGLLLFLARLLTVHGFTHAPAVVLSAAAAVEALAPATVLAGRLPGCGALSAPADALVSAWGPAALPALAAGAAALTLLAHAARTLTKASAHAREDHRC
ncbi:hypothetical protein IAG44_13455 [Streptomyces roseirectus]|uniref:Integral membrane protein n=1 Tax=Streptomyces roseirectus TaxID=2768066 RepID=A0A7H0IC38_9ACTN|nr:hypothetical protein [Streptomyces roseirectus]QNP70354.1 hypothetical protein IAG44_13455 [Streptomyces roseirectus]